MQGFSISHRLSQAVFLLDRHVASLVQIWKLASRDGICGGPRSCPGEVMKSSACREFSPGAVRESKGTGTKIENKDHFGKGKQRQD